MHSRKLSFTDEQRQQARVSCNKAGFDPGSRGGEAFIEGYLAAIHEAALADPGTEPTPKAGSDPRHYWTDEAQPEPEDALAALCDEWEECGVRARKRYEGRKPGRKPIANIDDADADDVTAIVIATIIPEVRAAALRAVSQPLTDEMIEAETQRLVDGHFVNAFIDRQVMVSLAKWARGFAVSQPTQIVHCRECSMVDCPGPTETD